MLGATAAALALRKHVDLPGIWKDPVPDFDTATEYLVWLNEQRYEEWIIHDRRSQVRGISTPTGRILPVWNLDRPKPGMVPNYCTHRPLSARRSGR